MIAEAAVISVLGEIPKVIPNSREGACLGPEEQEAEVTGEHL